MKTSQLNAISYSYSEKRKKANLARLAELQLDRVFKYQTIYKTAAEFVKGYEKKQPRFLKAMIEASLKVNQKAVAIDKNPTAKEWAKKQILADLEQVRGFFDKVKEEV